jgi:hypothetical protein
MYSTEEMSDFSQFSLLPFPSSSFPQRIQLILPGNGDDDECEKKVVQDFRPLLPLLGTTKKLPSYFYKTIFCSLWGMLFTVWRVQIQLLSWEKRSACVL